MDEKHQYDQEKSRREMNYKKFASQQTDPAYARIWSIIRDDFSPRGIARVEDLIRNQYDAESIWLDILETIEKLGIQKILESPKVMDLGGGAGEFSKLLNSQGIFCVSLDIKEIRNENSQYSQHVTGLAQQLPFSKGSFNIVTAHGSLDIERYPLDWDKIFPEILRVMSDDGILVIFMLRDSPPICKLEQYFKPITEKGQNWPAIWVKKEQINSKENLY